MAADDRPPTSTLERRCLPPLGVHGPEHDFVTGHQRERIMYALATSVARYGLPATTIDQIVTRAGVSRHTFHSQFAGKDDLLVQTYDDAATRLLDHVLTAVAQTDDPAEQLRRCLSALLDGLASEPTVTRLCIVDIPTAGPQIIRQRDVHQAAFAAVLRRIAGGLGDGELPPLAAEGLAGAIHELLHKRVAQGRTDALPALLDDLHGFSLTVLRPHATTP